MDIEIEDIAHGLAFVARWNGQTHGDFAYSVAEHSLLVEALFRRIAPRAPAKWCLAALLHEQQLDRTQRGRNRPLLENGDRREILEELMQVRDPLYREIADMTVETDGRRVKEVAAEIRDAL